MKKLSQFKNPASRERYFEAYETAMAQCPAPDAVHNVETRFGTTRVYRFGQGDAPPIVLLPGLSCTSACWAPLLPALAARHPVYTVDTLGEPGASVQTAPLTDVADEVSWLADVLERLGLTGIHLVGGSAGGWHATNYAIHRPDRLASVTLLEPTTVTAGYAKAFLWYGLPAAVVNRDWLWRRFMRWAAGEDVLDRPAVRLILTGIRTFKASGIPPQTCPADDDLRSIRVPMLAVFGERAVVQDSSAAAARLQRLLPHAEVELWPDYGHRLYLDESDAGRITTRVLGFVRQPSSGGRLPR
ncbi:alpha/beta hydrolase [Amycolatopsis sp.]|uniref:alpha/beta fold hydrolase n=1 Tax=Amycolatopsis sp. TaxID=37632 RepID=UPI002E0C211C|nr:alpha/beta hydrolase [Amycolatopsis sp.]